MLNAQTQYLVNNIDGNTYGMQHNEALESKPGLIIQDIVICDATNKKIGKTCRIWSQKLRIGNIIFGNFTFSFLMDYISIKQPWKNKRVLNWQGEIRKN